LKVSVAFNLHRAEGNHWSEVMTL